MKHVIHDWPDDKSTTILRNCRGAARPGARLVPGEMVIPPGNDPTPAKLLDLEMLVIAGGKERTVAEYASLLAGAGWKLTRVVQTKAPTSVIEREAVLRGSGRQNTKAGPDGAADEMYLVTGCQRLIARIPRPIN